MAANEVKARTRYRLAAFLHCVMAGHSRQKDGVASLAYVPAISIIWLRARLSEIAGTSV